MADVNDFKLWSEDYVPGILAAYQNKDWVYGGKFMDKTVSGDELQFDFSTTMEMEALPDEFVDHDWQHMDYEHVKGSASGARISTRWRDQDIARMRENPIPDVLTNHMNALARRNSATFRDALTADVTAQYAGETTFSTKSMDAGNQIGSGAAITLANLRLVASIFSRRNALGNGETIYQAIAQEELDTLKALAELREKETNLGRAPAITGEIGNEVEGLQLVLDKDLNTSGGTRTCPAWIASGMAFMTQQAPKVRFGELPNTNYVPQAYMKIDNGALRVRRYGVVDLNTDDTYAF